MIQAIDSKNMTRSYLVGDVVCCEVVTLGSHSQLTCGMRGNHERYDNGPDLGLIEINQLPHFYK